jgi:predicted transcriptional regulator
MKKQKLKTKIIFVKTDEQQKDRLQRAADAMDSNVSNLVRDAVAEKLIRLCLENKEVARALNVSAVA